MKDIYLCRTFVDAEVSNTEVHFIDAIIPIIEQTYYDALLSDSILAWKRIACECHTERMYTDNSYTKYTKVHKKNQSHWTRPANVVLFQGHEPRIEITEHMKYLCLESSENPCSVFRVVIGCARHRILSISISLCNLAVEVTLEQRKLQLNN